MEIGRTAGASHRDLVQFAQICAKQAHIALDRDLGREFWRLAVDYQQKAAAADSGKVPDIGSPPDWFKA